MLHFPAIITFYGVKEVIHWATLRTYVAAFRCKRGNQLYLPEMLVLSELRPCRTPLGNAQKALPKSLQKVHEEPIVRCD